ncbi:SCAN domain-containing protein 3-like [Schistocerca serialis cubense]|uniref:SCAN domain-containing protein 3-like n=1 Tax=Schistocerca serialis cubense TaxID=2023355 RepID=UPI00214F5C9C|nr:SCAN domain-containing protein 3-like [Schistocerca serialis cubense]
MVLLLYKKNGVHQPQCVIFYERSRRNFFAAKCDNLKRMKLDTAGSFAQTSEEVLEATYELSLLISRTKKSHIIAETLVKSCLSKAADIVLGSEKLKTTSKAIHIMAAVSEFFCKNVLSWQKLIGVCTDGAPTMLGCRSGFVQMVREKKPSVTAIHCVIHCQALATKTLPKELNDVLKLLFTALCEDLGAEYKTLLFHTEVRCLSKGNMLGRLFELRDEVMLFLENNKQTKKYVEFRKPVVHAALAYLSDIFESLNTLNLQLWKRKILACNYSCFPRLFGILEEARFHNDFKDTDTKSKISNHLQHLIDEFERYFPNSCDDEIYYWLATDPFHVDVEVLPDRLQEKVLEIKSDSAAKYDFEKMDKPLFWVKYFTVYPNTAELYLPFSSTYLCERAFSAVVVIKNKLRSKLSIANDLRCAVSAIQPRIQNLVKSMQAHPSH